MLPSAKTNRQGMWGGGNPPHSSPPSSWQNGDADSVALGWTWDADKGAWLMAQIPNEDRYVHMYCVGATGSGKTKWLESLILQDIEHNRGFGVESPHSDLIQDVVGFIACKYKETSDASLLDRVVLVRPTDPRWTVTFNVLERMPGVSASKQANELITVFKRQWADSYGPRMEDLLRNSLIVLGETGRTFGDLPLLLTSEKFRKQVLESASHPIARAYFTRFDSLSNRDRLTWMEPVMNKTNAFLSDDRIRQMLSHPKSSFNLREVMDQGMILLVDSDKGQLGDGPSDLINALFMAKIQMAAFSRSDIPEAQRKPWTLYLDEFQNFCNESFAVVLSEARKYRLSLVMANQTLEQIPA